MKEITLLGQNVNSYSDSRKVVSHDQQPALHDNPFGVYAEGFRSVYKPKREGVTFSRLLDDVASVNREIRIRFTSPHPKDFSNEVCRRRLAKSQSETIVNFWEIKRDFLFEEKRVLLPTTASSREILKLLTRIRATLLITAPTTRKNI